MGAELDSWNKLHQTAIDVNGNGTFEFDDDVATHLAQLCAYMSLGVDVVLKNIDTVTNVPDFGTRDGGTLTSGHTLAQKFVKAANDLRDRVLPEHKSILTAMGETFLAAKKIVDGKESDSVQGFKDVQVSVERGAVDIGYYGLPPMFFPGTLTRYNWDTSEDKGSLSPGGKGVYVSDKDNKVHYTPEYQDKLAGLHELTDLAGKITGDKDTSDINVDMGESLSWNDMYANFAYMDKTADTVLNIANDWKGLADALSQASDQFAQGLQLEFGAHHFRGDGATQAIKSAMDYGKQMTNLIDTMNDVAENLRLSASWIHKTRWYMPEVDEKNFRGNHTPTQFVTEYNSDQTKWNEWYVVGANASSSCVPILPSADGSKSPMAPAAPPEQPAKPNPDDDKKNAPGVNPSGSPTATPTTTPTPDTPTTPDNTQPTNPTNTNPTNTQNTDLSTLASTLSTIAQQGVSMVETLAQDASTLVQSLVSSSKDTNQPTTTTKDELQQLQQQLATLTNSPITPSDPSSPGGSPGSPSSPGGATPKGDSPQTKLFPRANVPASTATAIDDAETVTTSRAGLASTSSASSSSSGSGTSGMPMSGAGAQGAGQGGKEHKRPDYLKSAENFAEAVGAIPEAVNPVAEK